MLSRATRNEKHMNPTGRLRRIACRMTIAAVLIAAAAHTLVGADPAIPAFSSNEPRTPTDHARIRRAYGALAMRFEPTGAAARDGASYVARGAGYSVFIEPTQARLRLRRAGGQSKHRLSAGPGRTGDEVVFGM
jgi:hypothetical protein